MPSFRMAPSENTNGQKNHVLHENDRRSGMPESENERTGDSDIERVIRDTYRILESERRRVKEQMERPLSPEFLERLLLRYLTKKDKPAIRALYEKNEFTDKEMCQFHNGDIEGVAKRLPEGAFIRSFSDPSVEGQWNRDLETPNHLALGLRDPQVPNQLIGYMDGYAPFTCASDPDGDASRSHRRIILEYLDQFDSLSAPLKRIMDEPERGILIGTIAIDRDVSGRGLGKIMIYHWVKRLLRKLPLRKDREDYRVFSFRFNHIEPMENPEAAKHIDDLVRNQATAVLFQRMGFTPIQIREESPILRAGFPFEAAWLHETHQLRPWAVAIRRLVRKHIEKHNIYFRDDDEWEELCKKHLIDWQDGP